MRGRWVTGVLAAAIGFGSVQLSGQLPRPLAPLPPDGLTVNPFFDGWYANPDGTFTLSFGYFNRNRNEVVEIPLGPDNFVRPTEYDGRQPTSFPPADYGGLNGRRERGVFTVTVPAGFRGDVVWTLRNRGQTFSVPGRATSGAYQLSYPMAMGSMPPLLRFRPGGPAGRGPTGIEADPLRASVGTPITLTIWLSDDSVREPLPVKLPRPGGAKAAMNVTWFKHSGPGTITFEPSKEPIENPEGKASTSATFSAPGDYVVRVRGDNFGEIDSTTGDQCCWTNGYVKIAVGP